MYSVTLADGSEDADKWQGKAGDGEYQSLPLEGLEAGTQVSLKYAGEKKVKSVKAKKKAAASLIVNPAVGQVIGDDGKNYADVAAATSAGATAVAVIAYVGSDTYDATFKNGLAIALDDEGSMNWSTAMSTCEGKTAITGAKWCMPSKEQWKQIFKANGGDKDSYTGLNTTITNAGGTTLQEYADYWASDIIPDSIANYVYLENDIADWYQEDAEDYDAQARACLAF